jgi:hypothetical protein
MGAPGIETKRSQQGFSGPRRSGHPPRSARGEREWSREQLRRSRASPSSTNMFAVTARSRCPTCSPIRAQGTPPQVEQRDASVAEVVRREGRHAGRPAGASSGSGAAQHYSDRAFRPCSSTLRVRVSAAHVAGRSRRVRAARSDLSSSVSIRREPTCESRKFSPRLRRARRIPLDGTSSAILRRSSWPPTSGGPR